VRVGVGLKLLVWREGHRTFNSGLTLKVTVIVFTLLTLSDVRADNPSLKALTILLKTV
jgi:hypothetical protein